MKPRRRATEGWGVVACGLAAAAAIAAAPGRAIADPSAPVAAPLPPPPPGLRLKEGQHFRIDPVLDGVLILGGAGFTFLLAEILSTGEIQPVPPGSPDKLLSIDRVAVTQTIDPHAATISSIGLGVAIGYAVLDPILSGLRDGRNALLVDAILYAESIVLTEAFTEATKIAVRRPRPIDYVRCGPGAPPAECNITDLQLSFFSAHAAVTSAIGATATYLAFMRAPGSARAWYTLAGAVALTTLVSVERVRSGQHFPTDVITGAMAGAGIGVLVPHLHRHSDEAPTIWLGFGPRGEGGGTLVLGGRF